MSGDRFLFLNTTAMGTLFRDLVSTLGSERAKGFLIRYGWSFGTNDANAICKKYPDAPVSFLLDQGPILHTLEGIGEAVVTKFITDQTSGTFYREGHWVHSFEAEQHVNHFGRSDDPVCWMMIGFASGFCSRMFGKRILYKEVECVGRGDERCTFIGKTVEEWGEECIHELSYYEEDKIAEELEEANRRIHQQHRLLQQIMNFHKILNQMVLDGQNRQVIIDEIGQMVDAPVVVEDSRLNPLAWYMPKSEQNHDANLQDYFLGSIQENCSSFATQLKQIEREKRVISLVFKDDVSILPRTVSPIIVGQEVMGFLSVVHTEDSNKELIEMIVERAASVLAFDALREQTALETEYRLKGEFLDELLSDGAPVELLQKRARYMGHDFNQPHCFLLISTNRGASLQTSKENQQMLTIRKKVVNIVRSVMNTYKQKTIIDDKREGIIVLTDMEKNSNDFDLMIKYIQNRCREVLPDFPLSICISRESSSIEQLRIVFEECQNTQNVMKRLEQKEEIIFVEKITLFDLLYVSTSQDQLIMYAERVLENLLEYDLKYGGSQLIQTLYVFLENKCNHEQTSRDLNVSSSGLKYRMRRIREIGEINLEDPIERFNLQLAINILIANGKIPLPRR